MGVIDSDPSENVTHSVGDVTAFDAVEVMTEGVCPVAGAFQARKKRAAGAARGARVESLFTGWVYMEVCARHPLTHEGLYVVTRVGRESDAGPQAGPLCVVLAFFDSERHDSGGVEVEEDVAEVKLC